MRTGCCCTLDCPVRLRVTTRSLYTDWATCWAPISVLVPRAISRSVDVAMLNVFEVVTVRPARGARGQAVAMRSQIVLPCSDGTTHLHEVHVGVPGKDVEEAREDVGPDAIEVLNYTIA